MALQPIALTSTAVSSEARQVQYGAIRVVKRAEASQSLFGAKTQSISSLTKIVNDCSINNWDGQGADPVDSMTLRRVIEFIRAFPDGLLPEFAPEPDGSISIDWMTSRYQRVSLSIGKSNRIAYAWLSGSNQGHGVETFDGLNVPSRILDIIRSIIKHDHASIRVA